jgi:hypothetical protein
MRALETPVLEEAWRIQTSLLGSGSNCDDGGLINSNNRTDKAQRRPNGGISDNKANSSFLEDFYISPLFYWNCSIPALTADKEIMTTINERSSMISGANITLRHSTVFAGKKFGKEGLLAADALVLTLFSEVGSSAGRDWNENAEALAREGAGRWTLYPGNGRVRNNQLYEFRFQPMSLKDDVLLALAYGLMAIYVVVSLRKLRAVKSQLGLAVSVLLKVNTPSAFLLQVCMLILYRSLPRFFPASHSAPCLALICPISLAKPIHLSSWPLAWRTSSASSMPLLKPRQRATL